MGPIILAACGTTTLAMSTVLGIVDGYSTIKDTEKRKVHITLLALSILSMLGSSLIIGASFAIACGSLVSSPLLIGSSLAILISFIARSIIYKKNPSLEQYYNKTLNDNKIPIPK